MYSAICVELLVVGLALTKIDPLLAKKMSKNDFYTFVPSDLDI